SFASAFASTSSYLIEAIPPLGVGGVRRYRGYVGYVATFAPPLRHRLATLRVALRHPAEANPPALPEVIQSSRHRLAAGPKFVRQLGLIHIDPAGWRALSGQCQHRRPHP